jgi:hypothetical protein
MRTNCLSENPSKGPHLSGAIPTGLVQSMEGDSVRANSLRSELWYINSVYIPQFYNIKQYHGYEEEKEGGWAMGGGGVDWAHSN